MDFGDLLDYLLRDSAHPRHPDVHGKYPQSPQVRLGCRAAARVKPVIVLKPRDFRAGSVEDAVYDAVFQRAGILRVDNIEQLFAAAETLATAKPVFSNRLMILSNSYSLALLTSDALHRGGGQLTRISEETRAQVARACRRIIRSKTRSIWVIWPAPRNMARRWIYC